MIPVTQAPREPVLRFAAERTFEGRRAVETLGKRSAGITIATLALMIIGYYSLVTAMASDGSRVHCSGNHFPLTCTSGGETFTLTARS